MKRLIALFALTFVGALVVPTAAQAAPYLPMWEGKRALRGYGYDLADPGRSRAVKGCQQTGNWVGCVVIIATPSDGISCFKAKAVRKRWSGGSRFSDINRLAGSVPTSSPTVARLPAGPLVVETSIPGRGIP